MESYFGFAGWTMHSERVVREFERQGGGSVIGRWTRPN